MLVPAVGWQELREGLHSTTLLSAFSSCFKTENGKPVSCYPIPVVNLECMQNGGKCTHQLWTRIRTLDTYCSDSKLNLVSAA